MPELKFEEALKKLGKIVEDLERGDIPLDESLGKYEEGVALARLCQKKLEEAKEKIVVLLKSKEGKVKLEPFAPDAEKEAPPRKKKKREEGNLFEGE